MVLAGSMAGIATGMASARFIDALLYGVKPGDVKMVAIPALVTLFAALRAE